MMIHLFLFFLFSLFFFSHLSLMLYIELHAVCSDPNTERLYMGTGSEHTHKGFTTELQLMSTQQLFTITVFQSKPVKTAQALHGLVM